MRHPPSRRIRGPARVQLVELAGRQRLLALARDAVGGRSGRHVTTSTQLRARVVERDPVVGCDPLREPRRRRARGSAAGAAPRRRSADRRCPAGGRGSPVPSSCGPNESVTPASNQQIIPALAPQSTMPFSQASRSSTSMPCTRQIASMFAVLPPPTQIASCEKIRPRRSSGGQGNVRRWSRSARPREQLVEPDDRPVRFRGGRRDVEQPRPLLARSDRARTRGEPSRLVRACRPLPRGRRCAAPPPRGRV